MVCCGHPLSIIRCLFGACLQIKEIVFRRPSVKLDILPDPLAAIERVPCAKLLGVFIDCRLKFTEHVDYVIKVSNQRL